MSTSVTGVTNHFPSTQNGFTTTTSGSVGSGAATVGLNSVAGYTDGETVVFIIDPDNAKKQAFTGTMDTSGLQVTDVVWTAGTNTAHDAGATVVDYASSTHINMMTKGIEVHANQDGTLKDDSVVTANITDANVTTAKIADANVTTDKIADASITNAKLDTTAGELGGAWQDWTPTYGGSGGMTYTSVASDARYTKIGKTVFFEITAEGTIGGTSSTSLSFTLPVPEKDTNSQALGSGRAAHTGGTSIGAFCFLAGAGLAYVRVYNTAGWTAGSGRSFSIAGSYEAA